MHYLQLVELAPHMRPAGRLLDGSALIKMMKTGVGVGLQDSPQAEQVLAWMFAFPIGRVGEPYRRGGDVAGGTIITNVGPKPSSLGLAITRRQHRNRCVIGM